MNEIRPRSTPPHWDRVVEPDKPFHASVALGNMTQWTFSAFWLPNGYLMVAIENKGAYQFRYFVDAGYAAEKLGLRFSGDGANVADWINAQLDLPGEYPVQGKYDRKLCKEDHELNARNSKPD